MTSINAKRAIDYDSSSLELDADASLSHIQDAVVLLHRWQSIPKSQNSFASRSSITAYRQTIEDGHYC